eukprot:11845000-Prorocentrum_lima.AAC.1
MCIRDRLKLPPPRSVATSRLVKAFNHVVHHDLLLVDSHASQPSLDLPTQEKKSRAEIPPLQSKKDPWQH